MYDEIIDRIVDSLPANTAVNRRPHYKRLRDELDKEMRRTTPALSEREMRTRMLGLEDAIQRREDREREAIIPIPTKARELAA